MNIIENQGIHFHLNEVEDIAGFTPINVEKGNYFWLLTKKVTTSDESEFYRYIEQLSNPIFNKLGITPNAVYQFLILIHSDLGADLYLNDFPIMIEIMAKYDVSKGQILSKKDIADIRKLRFPSITIFNTDKIIFCFKEGWKFGLFFDLNRELDINTTELDLGTIYRKLSFQHVYDVLTNEKQFEQMIKDGWFPFIEIIGSEYWPLSEAYANRFHFEEKIDDIVANFNKTRIERITDKWWKKQIFADKKEILKAGINAFLRNDSEGYINCISTLLPQIEGIIMLQCFADTGKGAIRGAELLSYIIEKGKGKSGSGESLLLPAPFLIYLKDIVFAYFNIETGQVDLSRHSSTHGVAKAESYTKIKALQAILVLDQIYFYI